MSYSENGAKNHSLKLNIYIHSQSIVTEGRAWPIFLNRLSTRPVHIPPSCHQILWKVSPESLPQYQTVSTSALPLQGESSLRCGQCQGSKDLTASWWAKCIWSKTLPHPHLWGQVLHSPCWPLGRGWREMQSSPQRLQWGQSLKGLDNPVPSWTWFINCVAYFQ